jgi:demethylspheroidene O-methyltransferase
MPLDVPASAAPAKLSLGDRWHSFRNRLLASPAFQRWAVAFPLTRPVAEARAKGLFDLCAGFVYSQVLQACVQLRLFEMLRDGALDVEFIAARLGLSVADAGRLLEAAAALRLVERRDGGRFGLGVHGAALLGNPGVVSMIEHHAMLYADLRDPVGLLRHKASDTALGRLWPYASGQRDLGTGDVAAYSTLMASSQPLVAADVLAAYRLDRHRCLLDLGGGDGTFLCAAAAAAPSLRLMLFDLPAVAERARARIARAGIAVDIHGGDFRADALPTGADVVSLIRVIHDHEDETALGILSAAWQALPAGGVLLLAEPMAGTRNAGGVEAYFAFYLLAMGSGRPRRAEELTAMLHTAGFTQVRLLPTRRPMLVRVLVASK